MSPPGTSLRDRRRIQTARDIQNAALRLSGEIGYEQVTTEMIAAEAGVSLRTFFNYYLNKEAAIVGPREGLAPSVLEAFINGTSTISADFLDMLVRQFEIAEPQQDVIRLIEQIVSANPSLQAAFSSSLVILTGQLTEALQRRNRPLSAGAASLVASVIATTLARCFLEWGNGPSRESKDLLALVRHRFSEITEALSA